MEIQRPEPHSKLPEDAKLVHKGTIFDVYQWQQKLYDGKVATFERLKRPDTVCVIPVLPDGRILLINQQQPSTEPFVSEIAGRMEEGEDPLEAMKRELLEETGYQADTWSLWDVRQPVHKIDWAVYVFIAKGLKKVAEPNLDGGEKIELLPVTFDDFLEKAVESNILAGPPFVEICMARGESAKKEALRKLFSIE